MPKPGGGPQANYLIKWTINTRAGGTRAGRGAKGHWKGYGGFGMSNVGKSENICKLICAQDANCLWPKTRLHGFRGIRGSKCSSNQQ